MSMEFGGCVCRKSKRVSIAITSCSRRGEDLAKEGHLEALIKQIEKGEADGMAPFLVNPDGEGDELLVEMVERVESEYLSNPDHGLDAYLSMRVRHGSLAGHVRGPLQSAELVTSKKAEGVGYVENTRWKNELRGLSTKQQDELQAALARFSARVDGLLDEIIKNRLQIRGVLRPEGAFALPTTPMFLHILRAFVTAKTTASDFIDLVILMIEIRLTGLLTDVQGLIAIGLKDAIGDEMESLRRDLEEVLPSPAFERLNGAIAQCAPELQAAIDRVAEWFSAPKDAMRDVVATADWMVELALAATKSANAGFDPKVTKDLSGGVHFSKSGVSEFLDILFIILGNVSQHSGVGHSPWIAISITRDAARGPDACLVRVESQVAEGVQEASASRLQRIRDLIGSGSHRSQMNKEGGTGLLKLQRMIDLDQRRSLDFGFTAEGAFFMEIRMVGAIMPPLSEVIE